MNSVPLDFEPDEQLKEVIGITDVALIQGTEAFVFPSGSIDPSRVVSYIKRSGWRASRILLVKIRPCRAKSTPLNDRAQAFEIAGGIFVVNVTFGARDTPDLPLVLASCRQPKVDLATTTFVVGNERMSGHAWEMRTWRRWMTSLLDGRAQTTAHHFRLPQGRVFFMDRA